MEMELAGMVALVTGAARNIGREMVLGFSAAGASVVINAKTSKAEAERLAADVNDAGGSAIAILADVTDPADVDRMIAETIAAFGRLDILVNNAAVRDEAPFAELSVGAWHSVLSIVLDGAFNCTKAALPHLQASGHASIINMGGMTANVGAKNRAHVVAAKAGLAGLTRALAHEFGPDGITVNCVVPGLIDTKRAGPEPKHHAERSTLVGRRGTTDDVASMVRYLCGPHGRYITGQTIHLNGGLYMGG